MLKKWLAVAAAVALVHGFASHSGAQAGAAGEDAAPADLPAALARLADRSLLLDAARAGDSIVAVGEHGHVLVSTDNGRSWSQSPAPTRSTLTGVHFADAEYGIAVGHDAVILRTTDGGLSWEKVYFAPDDQTPLLDVWLADRTTGYAVGAYGLFLETSDGGVTWTRRPFFSETLPAGDEMADDGAGSSTEGEAADYDEDDDEFGDEEDSGSADYVDPEYGEDRHLNHITSAADGTLYLAAELGRFYRSDDGGQVWYRLPTPYEGSFFATLPLDNQRLLLMGMRGNLFYSADRGETLEPIETNTVQLLDAGIVDAAGRTIIIAGMGGVLLRSTDGGRSFVMHGQADRKGIAQILAAPDGGVLLFGEAGAQRLSEAEYMAGGRTEKKQ